MVRGVWGLVGVVVFFIFGLGLIWGSGIRDVSFFFCFIEVVALSRERDWGCSGGGGCGLEGFGEGALGFILLVRKVVS